MVAPEAVPAAAELPEAPVPGPRQGLRRKPAVTVASWLFLIALATYFVFPLVAMARFAFQRVPVILLGWSTLFDRWTWDGLLTAFRDENFGPTLWLSTRLAIGTIGLTLALMLPTAMWVHLRLPSARGLVETLTVLPYVVPPIALVVGVIGAYRDTTPWFFQSRFALIPFYAVLAMPFTYRSLDAGLRAIDLRTLVDASRSLGAGWGTTMFRVLMPNMRTSLLTASFLTATVVMGEFTMAQLMGKFTLPVYQSQFYLREVQGGIALGLVTLLATTVLLAFITFLTRRRGAAAFVAGGI